MKQRLLLLLLPLAVFVSSQLGVVLHPGSPDFEITLRGSPLLASKDACFTSGWSRKCHSDKSLRLGSSRSILGADALGS